MSTARRSKVARFLALPIAVAAMLTPGTASAGGHRPHGPIDGPAEYYSASPQPVESFPGDMADLSMTPWCYAIPIQAVYQFPAVLAYQPGAAVAYVWTDPAFGALGGQPYLYHP
jgi:hypothetical protein